MLLAFLLISRGIRDFSMKLNRKLAAIIAGTTLSLGGVTASLLENSNWLLALQPASPTQPKQNVKLQTSYTITNNPIPEPVKKSSLSVSFKEIVQIPDSGTGEKKRLV